MIEKNFLRMSKLAKELSSENMLEFLELYVILKAEGGVSNEIPSIIALKAFFEGVISARDSEVER
ncbi:hypothetical protein [Cetobacterium sp.]|uniref:hypothetical protein n=1 Tax=Cetobacterium sp. TaxID=2071632 RepID=UPI003F2CE34A